MHAIESIGPVLGIVAFIGLAVLAFLLFQQAREIRRVREWAGRAPERAAEAADAVQAAAEASRDGEEEEAAGGEAPPEAAAGRPRRAWQRFSWGVRDRYAAVDRHLPIDGRYVLALLAVAVIAAGVVTSGFGLIGGGGGDGGKHGSNGQAEADGRRDQRDQRSRPGRHRRDEGRQEGRLQARARGKRQRQRGRKRRGVHQWHAIGRTEVRGGGQAAAWRHPRPADDAGDRRPRRARSTSRWCWASTTPVSGEGGRPAHAPRRHPRQGPLRRSQPHAHIRLARGGGGLPVPARPLSVAAPRSDAPSGLDAVASQTIRPRTSREARRCSTARRPSSRRSWEWRRPPSPRPSGPRWRRRERQRPLRARRRPPANGRPWSRSRPNERRCSHIRGGGDSRRGSVSQACSRPSPRARWSSASSASSAPSGS